MNIDVKVKCPVCGCSYLKEFRDHPCSSIDKYICIGCSTVFEKDTLIRIMEGKYGKTTD